MFQIKSGDDSSKEELAVILIPLVSKILLKYIKDKDDRLSASGWIVTKVINSVDRFDLTKSAMGYINRISRNYAIDLYRASSCRGSKKNEPLEGSHSNISDSDDIENSIEFLIDDILCKDYSDIVKKVIIDKKEIRDVAEELQVSMSDVTTAVPQIRKMLLFEKGDK